MNHTTTTTRTTKTLAIVAVLTAITAALTGTTAISIQNAAAYRDSTDPNGNSIDKENSGTNSKFKEKEKNNCTGFTFCCNVATQSLGRLTAVPDCL